jgi:glycerol kinase
VNFQGGGSVVSRESEGARILSVDVGSSSVRAELYDDVGDSVDGTEVKFDYEFEYSPTRNQRPQRESLRPQIPWIPCSHLPERSPFTVV